MGDDEPQVDDVPEVTPEQAAALEAGLLAITYGMTAADARKLIDDARAAAGLDRLLRQLGEEG